MSDIKSIRNDHDHRIEVNQKRAQALLITFNSLSGDFLATLSVVERQVAVLQDLRRVFSTGDPTKAKASEKEYKLRQNPFFKDIALGPIFSECPERVWQNILGTIDEVVRERKSFTKKIKGLVENMDIRRKIV